MSASSPLILLTAGGTGGHVFPAEALAQVLLSRGFRVGFITDSRGTAYSGTLGSLETWRVSSAQMLGRGLADKARGALSLAAGVLQARKLLKTLRPAAVVGFGGYASVPAVAAAVTLKVPTVIHEQNAVLGRANRLFARRVSLIATAYEEVDHLPADRPVRRVGMPVREAIRALSATPYIPPVNGDTISLLVLGGSQGAQIFSSVVPEALALLPGELRQRVRIAQQARPEDVDRASHGYASHGLTAEVQPFFHDVPERLAACHLLIARSGASTVAEATTAGRPALLVPYMHAADDHQTANAEAVEDAGGAWVVPQPDLTPTMLAEKLKGLLGSPETLAGAAAAARAWSMPDAAAHLADAVETLLP